jgi:hypothetical protein
MIYPFARCFDAEPAVFDSRIDHFHIQTDLTPDIYTLVGLLIDRRPKTALHRKHALGPKRFKMPQQYAGL